MFQRYLDKYSLRHSRDFSQKKPLMFDMLKDVNGNGRIEGLVLEREFVSVEGLYRPEYGELAGVDPINS